MEEGQRDPGGRAGFYCMAVGQPFVGASCVLARAFSF